MHRPVVRVPPLLDRVDVLPWPGQVGVCAELLHHDRGPRVQARPLARQAPVGADGGRVANDARARADEVGELALHGSTEGRGLADDGG